MRTLANSEDPDEMPHDAAFHQGLHCLLREKQSSAKEIQFYLEIIMCDPSIYTIDRPKSIVSSQKEESFGTYRINFSIVKVQNFQNSELKKFKF